MDVRRSLKPNRTKNARSFVAGPCTVHGCSRILRTHARIDAPFPQQSQVTSRDSETVIVLNKLGNQDRTHVLLWLLTFAGDATNIAFFLLDFAGVRKGS